MAIGGCFATRSSPSGARLVEWALVTSNVSLAHNATGFIGALSASLFGARGATRTTSSSPSRRPLLPATQTLLWGDADSVFGVPEALVRSAYARECGAGAAASALGEGVAARPWLDVLEAMAAACGDGSSFMPLAGREIWYRHTDAVINLHDVSTAFSRVTSGCESRADHSRACICYVYGRVAVVTTNALVSFLSAHPQERLVLVSSSNYDNCMVDGPELSREDSALVRSLLEHPRLNAWFTEDACEVHAHIFPLPIGPKFRTTHEFGAENVAHLRTLYMGAVRRAVEAGVAGRPRKGLFVRLSEGTSESSAYPSMRSIRRTSMPHMLEVARDFEAIGAGGAAAPAGHAEGARDLSALEAVATALPYARSLADTAYMDALASQRLSWSPPGAGLDVHRTWESLLVGTPPVVAASPLSPMHAALPVVEVQDFSAVTAAQLAAAADALERTHPAISQRRPVPQVFAFWWLARFEEEARRVPM